ncbi:hypothetical protein G9A89_004751 [Geosiphon pyriformis]|nr:hypothetical protein G9A89_004751 [Geosiphon pyriformis]
MNRITSNIILLLPARSKVEYSGVVYQQIQEKILLHSDMKTITINQWGRINNTQVEDVKNRVEQTILEKKVLELIQNEDLDKA